MMAVGLLPTSGFCIRLLRTNMEGMFENSAGNMELSEWDVSKVGQVRGMFRHATGFRSLNVSKWNVRAITDMEEMFAFSYGVKNLTEWDVSHVIESESLTKSYLQQRIHSETRGKDG